VLPTLLYTALAGSAGFLAALLSFLFNTQLESILRFGGQAISKSLESNTRRVFLELGLITFALLMATVATAVLQWWGSIVLFAAAGGTIGFAWVQSIEFLRYVTISISLREAVAAVE